MKHVHLQTKPAYLLYKKKLKKLFALISFLFFCTSLIAQNTKYGTGALFSNTSGINNSAFGIDALYKNTLGYRNTGIGASVLYSNTTGNDNAAIGTDALLFNTTGGSNTAIGYYTLTDNTIGNYNTAIGSYANVAAENLSNATAIGFSAKATASNTIQLGNGGVTKVFAGTGTKATLVAGGLQITGGELAAGKVLTSDANGVATWAFGTPGPKGDTGPAGKDGIVIGAWSLQGNMLGNSEKRFFGTTDASSLIIKTNNIEQMRVTPAGNVGIGTSSPATSLHISTTKILDGFKVSHTVNGFWAQLFGGSLGHTSYNNISNQNDAGIIFGGAEPGEGPSFVIAPWSFSTSGLRISNKGNITVSTFGQLDALGIRHSNNYWTNYFAGSLGQGSYNGISKINDAGIIFGGTQPGTGPGFVIAPWNLSAGGIRVDNNGNVTIGVIENIKPGYKLFVEQGILTEKVRVAVKNSGDWADYVFDKKYELMPLKKVEEFIKINNHLPNIPSADEAVKKGIDIGEMNAKLLGKIEELTLYIIEVNKKVERLEQENATLKIAIANTQKQ